MKKAVLLFGQGVADLAKAHVDQFTRKDGSVVQAHDTKVTAAVKPAAPSKPAAPTKPQAPAAVTHDSLKGHPNYSEADHNYFKGKGWDAPAIKQRWDEEHARGVGPQLGNKHAKPGEAGYMAASSADAMPAKPKPAAKPAGPKLDPKHVAFVEDQLTNNESSSDKELHDHFVKEGLHPAVAKQVMKHRNAFLSNTSMTTPDHIKRMAR